jgi:protein transport protein SEC20
MAEEQGGKETVIRGDGTVLKESEEPRNPKKRMFDTEVEREKEKVVRGDGTVLEERSGEPVNPKKRGMDTGADEQSRKRDEL